MAVAANGGLLWLLLNTCTIECNPIQWLWNKSDIHKAYYTQFLWFVTEAHSYVFTSFLFYFCCKVCQIKHLDQPAYGVLMGNKGAAKSVYPLSALQLYWSTTFSCFLLSRMWFWSNMKKSVPNKETAANNNNNKNHKNGVIFDLWPHCYTSNLPFFQADPKYAISLKKVLSGERESNLVWNML